MNDTGPDDSPNSPGVVDAGKMALSKGFIHTLHMKVGLGQPMIALRNLAKIDRLLL